MSFFNVLVSKFLFRKNEAIEKFRLLTGDDSAAFEAGSSIINALFAEVIGDVAAHSMRHSEHHQPAPPYVARLQQIRDTGMEMTTLMSVDTTMMSTVTNASSRTRPQVHPVQPMIPLTVDASHGEEIKPNVGLLKHLLHNTSGVDLEPTVLLPAGTKRKLEVVRLPSAANAENDSNITTTITSRHSSHSKRARTIVPSATEDSFPDDSPELRVSPRQTRGHYENYYYTNRQVATALYICPVKNCRIKYTTMAAIHDHLLVVHRIQKYRCFQRDCGKTFPLLDQLKVHLINDHIGRFQWACCFCNRWCRSHTQLTAHFARFHQPGIFTCLAHRACPYRSGIRVDVEKHIAKRTAGHNNGPVQCYCGVTFKSGRGLLTHQQRVHW